MEQYLLEISEQQKKSWNKSSPGWRKWDDLTMDFLKPYGDAIINNLDIQKDAQVLDVAAGTGEPGLTIAKIAVDGKVIITDLADEMLVIAYDNAQKSGIQNIEFCACDVSELPFDDNSFDAISCRMGFMFFPDIVMALKEMKRVLKPGGKISSSVWSTPEHNFWIAASMGVIKKYVELPTPNSNGPGMFRCAKPGLLEDLFEEAGFTNVKGEELFSTLNCGTADTYWSFVTEVVGPVVSALGQVDQPMREKIRSEVYDLIHQKYASDKVFIDSGAYVVSAEN